MKIYNFFKEIENEVLQEQIDICDKTITKLDKLTAALIEHRNLTLQKLIGKVDINE